MESKVIFLVSILMMTSCVTTKPQTKGSYVLLEKSNFKPLKPESVNTDSVAVFFKKDPPSGSVEVGIVEATAWGREVSLQDLFPELQRQAGVIGANGISKIELQRFDHAGDAMSATAVAIKTPGR